MMDVPADRYFQRFETEDVSQYDEPEPIGPVTVQTLDEFADDPEEPAVPLLGDGENVLLPEGGDGMMYGDGGAGKTTMLLDAACHFAAGDSWIEWAVPRPLRVLLIENEGPRPFFRAKLRRKRGAWAGSDLGDRLRVLADPWGRFTYADERWREVLADIVRDHDVDVVICGPLTTAGMEAAGTLQEVRAFLDLVDDVRRRAARAFGSFLVHHENKGGQVSGAWEGAGDTLLHLSAQGSGKVRLHVQKARHASESHGKTLQLRWGDGETFEVEETPELTDEDVAEKIVAAVSANPGTGWTRIVEATPGIGDHRRRAIRDRLLADSVIVNVLKEDGVDTVVAEVPERRPARLFRADDPTLRHLRRAPAAGEPQTAAARGAGGSEASAACGSTLVEPQAVEPQTTPPLGIPLRRRNRGRRRTGTRRPRRRQEGA
jgi:hypothetical protein